VVELDESDHIPSILPGIMRQDVGTGIAGPNIPDPSLVPGAGNQLLAIPRKLQKSNGSRMLDRLTQPSRLFGANGLRTGPDGRRFAAADIHAMTLANLHEEFATITTTDEVIAALG
jgi:hypothetical protein